jgi:hypothetical protein
LFKSNPKPSWLFDNYEKKCSKIDGRAVLDPKSLKPKDYPALSCPGPAVTQRSKGKPPGKFSNDIAFRR